MWASLLLLFTITSIFLTSWFLWWKNRPFRKLSEVLPGPPSVPILGNALVFTARYEELLDLIDNIIRKHGEYIKFWLGQEFNVIVSNPDDVKRILTSCKVNHKGPLYDELKKFVGSGILSGGVPWRNHRKIATPAYNKKAISHFSKIFNKEAEDLAETLSKKDPNVTFNVYLDVVKYTTQSVCQTLMGLSKEDSQNVKRLDELIYSTHEIYTFIFENMTRWWLHVPLVDWFMGRKKKEKRLMNLVKDISSDILEKRRKAQVIMESDIHDEAVGVVDRFLLSKELMDKEIISETFTLFTTSQEASAKIASAVLLFLAHLPEWQELVYNEIIDMLGPEDNFVNNEDLKKLVHLEAVFKEALRYLAIAAFIQRTVEEEISICDGKLTLPPGTSVIIPIHSIHRDPRFWEDPYKVKPERFLPENTSLRNHNAFIPFSLGAMDCLGRVYATSLIKTFVVRTIRRVQLEADGRLEDLELHVAISVKFSKGYLLRCKPRNC